MNKLFLKIALLILLFAPAIAESTATYTFDVSTPTGSDNPTQGDDRIRELKNAIHERENKDHYWEKSGNTADADDVGFHRKVTLLKQSSATLKTDAGILYTKDVSTRPELFYLDEAGNDLQITSGGSLNAQEAPGVIKMYGGSSAPTGYLLCDGSAVSRSTYSALFAVIGTAFGAGDGSTTFNLPDLRDRFPLGKGTTYSTLGATAGSATHDHGGNTGNHTLTVDEIPAHTHTHDAIREVAGGLKSGSSFGGAGGTTGSTGGGQAHNHPISSASSIPPAQVFNYIIKT